METDTGAVLRSTFEIFASAHRPIAVYLVRSSLGTNKATRFQYRSLELSNGDLSLIFEWRSNAVDENVIDFTRNSVSPQMGFDNGRLIYGRLSS